MGPGIDENNQTHFFSNNILNKTFLHSENSVLVVGCRFSFLPKNIC